MAKRRHWKQQFDPTGRYIFRRRVLFQGIDYEKGDPVPEAMRQNKKKLRNFWNADIIEHAPDNREDESEGQQDGQPEGQQDGQPEGQQDGQPEGQHEGQPEGQPEGQQDGQPEGQPEGQGDPDDEDDDGIADLPEGVTLDRNGPWYTLTFADGTSKKIRGKDAVNNFLESLK